MPQISAYEFFGIRIRGSMSPIDGICPTARPKIRLSLRRPLTGGWIRGVRTSTVTLSTRRVAAKAPPSSRPTDCRHRARGAHHTLLD